MFRLTGISQNCGGLQPGGLLTVEYLPLPYLSASAEHLVNSENSFVGALASIYTENWLSMQILLSTDREWKDSVREDEQGRFFDRTVEGSFAGSEPPTKHEINQMKQYRYLLRVRDRAGRRWLLNDPETAFKFTYSFSTGNKGTDGRKHQIKWAGQTPHEAVLWP